MENKYTALVIIRDVENTSEDPLILKVTEEQMKVIVALYDNAFIYYDIIEASDIYDLT